jgi:hypothetical protein
MIIPPQMAIATFTITKVKFINLASISCDFRSRGSGRFVGMGAVLSLSNACPSQAGDSETACRARRRYRAVGDQD